MQTDTDRAGNRNRTRTLLWAAAAVSVLAAVALVPRLHSPATRLMSADATDTTTTAPAPGTVQSVVAQAENVYEAMVAPPKRDANGNSTSHFSDDRAASPYAHVDAAGHAFLDPSWAGAMRSNAANALLGLFTPTLAVTMRGIVDHAIAMETGGQFVESGGGAAVKSFDSVSVNGDTATVKATVTQWDVVGQVQDDGTFRWANPNADIVVTDTLTKAATGAWVISARDWDWAPGNTP
jgi:hypothetical protein